MSLLAFIKKLFTSRQNKEEETLQDLIKKADLGDATAQFFLGMSYYNGGNVPQDYIKARKIWQKAAEQSGKDAQLIHNGLELDEEKEEKTTNPDQEEAEQGDVNAQYNLAVRYATRNDVPQDNAQAAYWYQKAADLGCAKAQFMLGSLYYDGRGVEQNYKETLLYWQKAAEQEEPEALYSLGALYCNGTAVQQDYKKAAY